MDTADTPTAGNGTLDKPRLTEQEKKNNHIASEQKRRQAIREGFDEIADIVPGLKGQGRSEALVLEGATNHIRRLLAERYQLVMEIKEQGSDSLPWELDEASMRYAKLASDDEQVSKRVKR